jgi:hypothetical protein
VGRADGRKRPELVSWLGAGLVAAGLVTVTSPPAEAALPGLPDGPLVVTSPGHLTVRLQGRVVDPDHAGPVKVHVWVHDGKDVGPVEVLTDSTGHLDATVPSDVPPPDKSGKVKIDAYAIDKLADGRAHFHPDSSVLVSQMILAQHELVVDQDTQPPTTTIVSGPPARVEIAPGTTRSMQVTFVSDEPASSTFACRLGAADWAPCASPATIEVGEGTHEFAVRAHDGINQGEPAVHRFALVPAVPVPQPAPAPVPTATPGAALRVDVAAVRRKSRVRVRVAPASAELDYRFVVQRKKGGKWKPVKRSATRKAADRRVLDLRRGRYRVVAPTQHGYAEATSKTVRLRR